MPRLVVQNLSKRFSGVTAVDDVSFSAEEGTITGIIGPNGSGKTTLINVLTGMAPSDGGTIAASGRRLIRRLGPRDVFARGITRTFQEVRLFNQMTVLENIVVALTRREIISALVERRHEEYGRVAERILREVGLWEKRDELALNLSYGQRKLLEIARVLVTGAHIYLFDEPFAGLSPQMVHIVAGALQKLREGGNTIILIEHNMELIRELSDHIIVMDSGKILAEGTPEEVLKRRDVIEAYLGA